ncbi:uncharacterized protein [Ptychodera flava]|uniref:uncharacterized protein n=1 Tax=Ptychodera flava TaxID=63121 RepID=UPI00396A765D
MGNCFACCVFQCQEKEPEDSGEVPKEEVSPPEVEVNQPVRSARKYGSTLSPRKEKSTEKTPLLVESKDNTIDETPEIENVEKKHKKSSLKKLKQKLMGKKSHEVHSKDEGSGDSRHEESKSDPTVSAAAATRDAYEGTVKRGEKLRTTEERTSSLASHAKSLSENAKLIAERKSKKSKT